MRLIRAVREFNRENGTETRTVAFFTTPDRNAMYVRSADETFHLGPASSPAPDTGKPRSSYLDLELLERALEETACDAVWPGWGLVAENSTFVKLCERRGWTFLGPPSKAMSQLGNKIEAKRLASRVEIPVAAWSQGPVRTLEEAQEQAEVIGYPLMVKAASGGGGRGIRPVAGPDDLPQAFLSARTEALQSSSDDTVFLETRIEGARHVEVQILADNHGTVWSLGVRDCSVQRRNQKVLEESPSPILTEQEDRDLQDAAIRLIRSVDYRSTGTVEFLFRPADRSFTFLEVNPRLQVEHPITEMRTGLDIVKLQLHLALGKALEGEPPHTRGHAVEVRLCAEDADASFAPSPGTLGMFQLPSGPGIRTDMGYDEGDSIPSDFDSMIGKVVASGSNREEALSRLSRAMGETSVVIEGGTSNRGFLYELVRHPDLVANRLDTSWLDQLVQEGHHRSRHQADMALVLAAVEYYEAKHAQRQARFLRSAERGRPEVVKKSGVQVDLELGTHLYRMLVHRTGPEAFQVEIENQTISLTRRSLGKHRYRVLCGGQSFRVLSVVEGLHCFVEVDGESHRIFFDFGGVVRSSSPAVVASVSVKIGDEVKVGDPLVVLEAMKIELQVTAPYSGRVRELHVIANQQVSAQEPLMVIEPAKERTVDARESRVSFALLVQESQSKDSPWEHYGRDLEELRSLILGYDVEGKHLQQLVAKSLSLAASVPPGDPRLLEAEDQVLEAFVDLLALHHREVTPVPDAKERLSTEEYLYTYLSDISARASDLPDHFQKQLRRALSHYGVENLKRTAKLEESLYRIWSSLECLKDRTVPILSLLQRRLDCSGELAPIVTQRQQGILDRIIATSEHMPEVLELTTKLRYQLFDEPRLGKLLEAEYQEMKEHLSYLASSPQAPDREARIETLVRCPHPLKAMTSSMYRDGDQNLRQVMLEVMTRRFFRNRQLEKLKVSQHGEATIATASFQYQGKAYSLHSLSADFQELGTAIQTLTPLLEKANEDQLQVVDIFAWRDEVVSDGDAMSEKLLGFLKNANIPGTLHRLTVALSTPGRGPQATGVEIFNFRANGKGLREDRILRGIHARLSERLDFWRLKNFQLTRLPSTEGVYLFHGVGKENASDERLFALGEVRDLTPVRDPQGVLLQLPFLERVFMEASAAIREFQLKRPQRKRLHWNRIQLVVDPPLNLGETDLQMIMKRLTPSLKSLGLERVLITGNIPNPLTGTLNRKTIHISNPAGNKAVVRFRDPPTEPLMPLSDYARKVVRLKSRGLIYPYELIDLLTPDRTGVSSPFPPGEFQEMELDASGEKLVAVDRPPGQNQTNIVVGVITSYTEKVPEGMRRVALLGDPSRSMGSLAEAECRCILAALDLAEQEEIPLEWYAISAGARIALDTGTENMDWIAAVLKRLIEFTQKGLEVNIVVTGINVGAQPYWNAEATMLMHTKGVLIMTPASAMVLTGKRALDYSGGVSATDNFGIGGYDRVMGPNGQAQYFASSVDEACLTLLRYYEHSYRVPGERFPRKAKTSDTRNRNVCLDAHGPADGTDFETIGDVFSEEKNPGRKKPFDIRRVMSASMDRDHAPLERWFGMHDAEIAVVWDAHIGGYPVCLLGLESRPLPRTGFLPADGPEVWTGGTLFPAASKKVARAINACSGNRPLVVLANLSGFDGSPDSLRRLQLEYGAEIGRAVTNFDGPIVFCVVSRYHGGAFVVFSAHLNDQMEVVALEGTHASVIGGAPAAAVVFAREVKSRTQADPRVQSLQLQLSEASGPERIELRVKLAEMTRVVHSEKLGEMATEFDAIHSVQRALKVGSIHRIVPPHELRPYLIDAIERGMRRTMERLGKDEGACISPGGYCESHGTPPSPALETIPPSEV
jgi:acetyl/propionyl-CoA carboxylase alpha subunit/acetyl-CoA carboxylase carboxyltransferase component